VHQEVAAVAIRSDPLVEGLRKSGVALRKVFRSPLSVEVCDAIGEWFQHGMIHPVPCGHRTGLLLRDAIERWIGRDFPFAMRMPVARNLLCGRSRLRGQRASEGE
jgi:hypothetical protein